MGNHLDSRKERDDHAGRTLGTRARRTVGRAASTHADRHEQARRLEARAAAVPRRALGGAASGAAARPGVRHCALQVRRLRLPAATAGGAGRHPRGAAPAPRRAAHARLPADAADRRAQRRHLAAQPGLGLSDAAGPGRRGPGTGRAAGGPPGLPAHRRRARLRRGAPGPAGCRLGRGGQRGPASLASGASAAGSSWARMR